MKLFSRDPWRVVLYRTYSDEDHLYLRGRALEDEQIEFVQNQQFWKTLKNSFKTFETDEIPHARIEISLEDGQKFYSRADRDGYFLLDQELDSSVRRLCDEGGYLTVKTRLIDKTPNNDDGGFENAFAKAKSQNRLTNNSFKGKTLVPSDEAEYGIISDIDDTIMHTGVTSFLKLRLVLNTFFRNFDQRIPLKNAPSLYQLLHRGADGKPNNPIFYLSNSPWNLYRYLEKFLDFHGFPEGPILLRNLTTPWNRPQKRTKSHKEYELHNIISHYHKLKFILIGDSGEHDLDYYIAAAQAFPDRVKAIYVRSVNHEGKMEAIRAKAQSFSGCPVLLADTSEQIKAHARENGWII